MTKIQPPALKAHRWNAARPNALVVACSDGRLQEATDAFLAHEFSMTRYDRFYIPGGGGAFAASGGDEARSTRMREECRYLVDLHAVRLVIVLLHGPTENGRIEAACADYRRKLPWAPMADLRAQQIADTADILTHRRSWAGDASTLAFRCEVDASGGLVFVNLDPDSALGSDGRSHQPMRRAK